MDSESVELLREAVATLKRCEALLRAQTAPEDLAQVEGTCPQCKGTELIPAAAMGDDNRYVCKGCGAVLEMIHG